jgi:hypothetical protein
MAKASDNVFPKVITAVQVTDIAAPSDGSWKVYSKPGGIYARSSNSVVGPFGAAGGSNPLTTKGDIIIADTGGTQTRLAAGATSGMVLTSAGSGAFETFALPQGFELSYVEFTSPVTINTTSEAAAVTVVTSAAITYSGSQRIQIDFYAPYSVIASTENLFGVLYDGSGSIGTAWQGNVAAVGSDVIAPMFTRFLTPSNASHTYSIRFYIQTTSGTVGAGAGGSGNYMPGYIRITTA